MNPNTRLCSSREDKSEAQGWKGCLASVELMICGGALLDVLTCEDPRHLSQEKEQVGLLWLDQG